MNTIMYCADAIVLHNKKFVVVERLTNPRGLALPGGKQDPGESLSHTVIRELKEETGLDFVFKEVLGTYAEPGRDPRGTYVSTVFIGHATGTLTEESGKTKILLLTKDEILERSNEFVFDHFKIFTDYLKLG